MLISEHDCVARFIREDWQCENGIIDPSVFTPKNEATEISVFVISDLQTDEIWQLGCRKLRRRSIAGRADLIVSSIYDEGFGMQNGNDRHAGIIPIPKLPVPDNLKDRRNSSALKERWNIAMRLINISDLQIK